MQLNLRAACVLSVAISLSGCGASNLLSDRIAGCYATKDSGFAELKISKGIDGYYFSFWENRAWTDSMAMRRPTPHELSMLFGADTAGIAQGLVTENAPFGIFRAKQDSPFRGIGEASNYAAWIALGALSVFPVPCEASKK